MQSKSVLLHRVHLAQQDAAYVNKPSGTASKPTHMHTCNQPTHMPCSARSHPPTYSNLNCQLTRPATVRDTHNLPCNCNPALMHAMQAIFMQ